jgi:hypothetical protein
MKLFFLVAAGCIYSVATNGNGQFEGSILELIIFGGCMMGVMTGG